MVLVGYSQNNYHSCHTLSSQRSASASRRGAEHAQVGLHAPRLLEINFILTRTRQARRHTAIHWRTNPTTLGEQQLVAAAAMATTSFREFIVAGMRELGAALPVAIAAAGEAVDEWLGCTFDSTRVNFVLWDVGDVLAKEVCVRVIVHDRQPAWRIASVPRETKSWVNEGRVLTRRPRTRLQTKHCYFTAKASAQTDGSASTACSSSSINTVRLNTRHARDRGQVRQARTTL